MKWRYGLNDTLTGTNIQTGDSILDDESPVCMSYMNACMTGRVLLIYFFHAPDQNGNHVFFQFLRRNLCLGPVPGFNTIDRMQQ